MKYRAWLAMAGALLTAACGGSDGDGAGGLGDDAAFLGIYQLTSFNENQAACDAPGTSTLAAKKDKLMVIVKGEVFGQKYLSAISCASVSDCQSKRAKSATFEPYPIEFSYTFTSSVDATTLSGFEAGTGTSASDGSATCVRRTYADHSLALSSSHAVHLESRTKKLADKPKDSDGFCFVDPAESKREAAGVPCSSLETLDATFLQAE